MEGERHRRDRGGETEERWRGRDGWGEIARAMKGERQRRDMERERQRRVAAVGSAGYSDSTNQSLTNKIADLFIVII
jgi:hypothetical protein